MKKLWQKHSKLDKTVETFETGDDLLLDQKLVWADVAGSLAHAKTLVKIGVLTQKEFIQIKKGLQEILKLEKCGKFTLTLGDEDMHTKIEKYLTDHCGVAGKKIHTGRSRNDQVLTAIRLFTKKEILDIKSKTKALVDALRWFSNKHKNIHMPGYTHMQKAMPSTMGMWAMSLVESLQDDLAVLNTAFVLVDQSPLGSAAGYGLPITLDRSYTAKLLGFAKVQENPIYCQNSRGKVEGIVVAALISILQTINKCATDVLLFTTSEFGFLTVSDELTTGSSIMPQKKNIDTAELLRSKVHLVLGNYNAIIGTSSNLPSGYNRDLQDTKKPLMESLVISKQTIEIATLLIKNIKPNKEKLAKAMTKELYATHSVLESVKKGIPFRDAYYENKNKLS